MSESTVFRFTGEQLRKINLMLPCGYKFITKEELHKRQANKAQLPKKKPSTLVKPRVPL